MNGGGLTTLRTRVNGSSLMQYTGRNVSIMGTVLKTHPNGKSFEIKTGDRQVVTVLLREPLNEPLSGLVEVQGLGQGKGQVQCDYFIPFSNEIGETFDAAMENEMVAVMHAVPNPWK